MEYELKNLAITSEDDTTSAAEKAMEAACSTCQAPNATKKCKKRHGGCKEKLYCDSDCEKQGHKKKAEEDEEEKKEKPLTAADMDAAFAKIAKKEEKKEKKKNKRACGKGSSRGNGCLRSSRVTSRY